MIAVFLKVGRIYAEDYFQKAKECMNSSQISRAIALFQKKIALEPCFESHLQLAKAYNNLKQWEKVVNHYQQAQALSLCASEETQVQQQTAALHELTSSLSFEAFGQWLLRLFPDQAQKNFATFYNALPFHYREKLINKMFSVSKIAFVSLRCQDGFVFSIHAERERLLKLMTSLTSKPLSPCQIQSTLFNKPNYRGLNSLCTHYIT